MFKLASVMVGLTMTLADDHINSNDVDAQYFVATFNENEFPISIGSCNPLDILGLGGYQMATCDGTDGIAWTYYSDASCSNLASEEYYNDTWQNGDGTLYDFNCDDDAVNAYADIEFTVGSCDVAKVTMYAALDVCTLTTNNEDGEVSIRVYCEENWAELQYYDSDGSSVADCDEDTVTQIANATDECGFMLKTGGNKIFGNIVECVLDGTTATPSPTDSANQVFSLMAFVVAGVMTYFAL